LSLFGYIEKEVVLLSLKVVAPLEALFSFLSVAWHRVKYIF